MDVNVNVYQHLLKFLIVGNAATGKTCLLRMFLDGKFTADSQHTIGVEFGSKIIQIDGKTVKLQIWDTAGQERFQSVTRSYYRGALGALIVYDVNDRESFVALEKWLSAVRELAQPDITVITVGNKIDLGEDLREVTEREGRQWAAEHKTLFVETSAKTGANVNEAFISAVRCSLARLPCSFGSLYSANAGKVSVPLIEPREMSQSVPCCRN